INHLGRIVEGSTVEADPESINADVDFPAPRTKADVFSFKAKKCSLGFDRINHLGRIVEGSTVEADPESIKAVVNFPTPRTKADVFSFLGLAGWCREFVPNFAKEARALTNMLHKAAPDRFDELTGDQQRAFDRIKELLTSAPALLLPDLSEPFELEVDASKEGFGAVLLQ
ncbi:MAG: ribonuclease H family protein, partial [Pseudomonadota bacterium]